MQKAFHNPFSNALHFAKRHEQFLKRSLRFYKRSLRFYICSLRFYKRSLRFKNCVRRKEEYEVLSAGMNRVLLLKTDGDDERRNRPGWQTDAEGSRTFANFTIRQFEGRMLRVNALHVLAFGCAEDSEIVKL